MSRVQNTFARTLEAVAVAVIGGVIVYVLTIDEDEATVEPPVGQAAPEKEPVTGMWDSFLGPLDLKQTGEQVEGRLTYAADNIKKLDGYALLEGKRHNQRLEFVWWLPQMGQTKEQYQGEGWLKLSEEGNTLEGKFTDKNHPGVQTDWILKRSG